MKADFTRDSFHPAHEFYRVLMQQGRVQVDADWNEQISILLHRLETLTLDVFGLHGGPEVGCGFSIFQKDGALWLAKGPYYVEGMRCENRNVVELELPQNREGQPVKAHVVYLDVFEQFVPAAQEPTMTDVALGVLDTTARSRIDWTARYWAMTNEPPADKPGAQQQWEAEWEKALAEIAVRNRQGLLRARASTHLGYIGSQNQLYRVEIHRGGWSDANDVTWKWSRENGSVAFAARVAGASVELVAGPSVMDAFSEGDWVEVVSSFEREDSEEKPPLRQVVKVDPAGAAITLDSSPGEFDSTDRIVVRCWNQRNDVAALDLAPTGGCLPLNEEQWTSLESGVEIRFCRDPNDGAPRRYRPGDYWLIPARTATARIEWPMKDEEGVAAPPRGPKHRFAPIGAILMRNGEVARVQDLRVRCKSLSQMT
jgi:hypothetical protein